MDNKTNSIWYGSDEVRGFHPIVEKCIKEALERAGLSNKYIFKHHYRSFTSGIPDFVILDKRTGDFVCIIEVKKTPTDVFSQTAGYQTTKYVQELYPLKWKLEYYPHFCVTNIEYLQSYILRPETSLIGCLLENSPEYAGNLDSMDLEENYIEILKNYFINIDKREKPNFSMYLETISESFNESFYNISQILGVNLDRISKFVGEKENLKQSVLYELFRFAFYYYLKEYYLLKNSSLATYFEDFENKKLDSAELINQIETKFSKIMQIDFVDIFKNYNSNKSLFPKEILANKELGEIFSNFIITLENNARKGFEKNTNLLNYVSLITSDIYDKEEMHNTGKIMSDELLSDILSGFSVDTAHDSVIDPCCGDGNLLVSAYKRKKELSKTSKNEISHNQILSELHGIDIDPNLIQLTAFKLIGQDLENVDNKTRTSLISKDFLDINTNRKFDSVVMNPPYLRNEKLSTVQKERWINNIEDSTRLESFIRNVSQPNLYYFFVEKAVNMINEKGTGAFIMMSKFLNNKDGVPLKRYLMQNLEAIIHYPPSFFEGFAVTTDIFILRNIKKTTDKISFLNIKNTDMLRNIDQIKKVIEIQRNEIGGDYSIVSVDKKEIKPEGNWRLYFIDPANKFSMFNRIKNLTTLDKLFNQISRGRAGNSGGSANLFPYSKNNVLSEYVPEIEKEYIGFGLLRNQISKSRRKFILSEECLNASKGLILSKEEGVSLSAIINKETNSGIANYIDKLRLLVGEDKIARILNETLSSKVIPEIIIPRGDRIKHSVFYYPFVKKPVLLSTNFFYLKGFRNSPNDNIENNIKFVTAFLISSLGQLQFEIHGNNQEGSRKIEKFIINKIKVINPFMISEKQVVQVVNEFDKLNSLDKDFLGNEENNSRDKLDLEICKILFTQDSLGFASYIEMKNYFQKFLDELIESRILI